MTDKEIVSEIMTRTVKTANSSEKVKQALQIMVSNDIGSLVVVENGKPVGILTERDITRRLLKGGDIMTSSIGDLCSKPLIAVKPDTPIWEAFETMLRKKIRRLPILENQKLAGIVTERDLFKWVVKVTYEPNIPPDLKKLIQQAQ